jgi:hypothetical protein
MVAEDDMSKTFQWNRYAGLVGPGFIMRILRYGFLRFWAPGFLTLLAVGLGDPLGPYLPVNLISSASAAERLDVKGLERALQVPGTVVLIRHSATFSGIGDPENFRLEDCSTQRNLSPEGRAQARVFGQWFRDRGLSPAAVRSSQWCRCLDTATEAFGGQPKTKSWSALNSFFQGHGHWPSQRDAIVKAVLDPATSGVARRGFEVWVTHQVLISSLTGVYLGMGELVVVRPLRAQLPQNTSESLQWQVVGKAFVDKDFR